MPSRDYSIISLFCKSKTIQFVLQNMELWMMETGQVQSTFILDLLLNRRKKIYLFSILPVSIMFILKKHWYMNIIL